MLRPVRWRCLPSLLLVTTILCARVGVFGGVRSAAAQDFRVATTVSQRAGDAKRWNPVAHSVTLFHAGKVYDKMEEVGEVVIFEPANSRFVILSVNGNNLATSLQFEQLQQYLKVARTEMQAAIDRLDPSAFEQATRDRRAALLFQLAPAFQQVDDPSTGTLTLIHELARYEVELAVADKPLVVQQYIQYADWAARLNYVLHSGGLYPDVRIHVNSLLTERDRIPTEVRLHLEGDEPVQLKAEHKFDWDLNPFGQAIIRQCEQTRTADTTRWVEFREYQRMLVAAMTK